MAEMNEATALEMLAKGKKRPSLHHAKIEGKDHECHGRLSKDSGGLLVLETRNMETGIWTQRPDWAFTD